MHQRVLHTQESVTRTRECHAQESVKHKRMTHASPPYLFTCTLILTTWRANLPSWELPGPHFSNAPMNLRTPWRKKWRASPPPAEENGPPRPTSCQLTNKLCSFPTPTAPSFEANNNQVASLAVEQLRQLSFLVAASSLEGITICACCGWRCHPVKLMSTASCAHWLIGCHGHIHIAQLRVASHRAPASPHTLAKILSGPLARIRNLPEWGLLGACQTRRTCCHSHLDLVIQRKSQPFQNQSSKELPVTLNFSLVGAPWRTALEPGPEWDPK